MTKLPDFAALDFDTAKAPETKAPANAQAWLTPEGIEVPGAYDESALKGLDFIGGYPGIAPFGRGPYPTMYVTNPWTVRQYAGFSTAEDSNAFYRRNLAAGQKGLYEIAEVVEKPTPTEAEQRLIVPGLRAGHYRCFFGMHALTPTAFRSTR